MRSTYMPTFQNKVKIMMGTVVFLRHINSHAVNYTLKMPHFQTAITHQLYGDNVIIIIIIMNNIFTRYNFTYQKYYVHERKEKGDLPTGRAHTSIEIRNTIFTRKLFKIHIYK